MQQSAIHIVPTRQTAIHSTFESESIYADNELCIERHTIHAGRVPLHYHDLYELEIVLSGEAQNVFMNHTLSFDRTALVFMSPVEVHHLNCNDQCKVLSLQLSAAGNCERIIRSLHFPFYTHLCTEQLMQIEAHLTLLSQELSHATPELAEILAHNFADWLVPYVICDAAAEPVPVTHTMTRIMEGLEYIRRHFRQNLTLTDVAKRFGYSPNYFGFRFKELTGMSFREYICSERLNYACHLLSQSELSISMIATECGFESTAYFSRCFLQNYHCTPTAYRQNR